MEKAETHTATSCTSLSAGRDMTADGSLMFARSDDWSCTVGRRLELHPAAHDDAAQFRSRERQFSCPLPAQALAYQAWTPFHLPGEWGCSGFNSAGVGMSATETIFSSPAALKADPLQADGLSETSIFNCVLPYIGSARQGVERLGSLIETLGCAEGFGVGFIDKKEVWYLESAAGHRWMAARIPDDMYFVTGNQSRLRRFDPRDADNCMGSSDLTDFAEANGLYDPKSGPFDFHRAYSKDDAADTTYNYPRVWSLQAMLTPSLRQDVGSNTFPVFLRADRKISLADVRDAYRSHYDGTSHDPYLHCNGREPYRPVSIFRTTQTHILCVRPDMPPEVGCVSHVALGMADLSVFLPFYLGIDSVPQAFSAPSAEADNASAYWKFRRVQALGMTNYNKYAPLIKSRYAALERENDERQREFERDYMDTCGQQPHKAHDMLQRFSNEVLSRALGVADELQRQLIAQLCRDVEAEYLFHGA